MTPPAVPQPSSGHAPQSGDLPALYAQLAADTASALAELPAGTIAERFHGLMQRRFQQLTPYRAEMGLLFSAALQPDSAESLLGPGAAGARAAMKASFLSVVTEAADAPRPAAAGSAAQSAELGAFLYGIHLLLLLFWLYDRTVGQTASREMLAITKAGIGLLRPALSLPPVARVLTRLAAALDAVLG